MRLGLPYNWNTVEKWLNPRTKVLYPPPPRLKPFSKKCPDVPALYSYYLPPSPDFWKSFPSHRMPSQPSSVINVQRLAALIQDQKKVLSLDQKNRADRVTHGEEFTDTLAWWIRKGYVAGPFGAPPLPDFRTNAMMAVSQKNKIRIIMDLSAPKGESYNDAIDDMDLEKVSMSSARLFGYSVQDCGIGARMWKFDMVDAYKTIPAAQQDLRLQGFTWLGKFFIELKKVFGSKEAVSAFDRLNNTLVTLAALHAHLPPPPHPPHTR